MKPKILGFKMFHTFDFKEWEEKYGEPAEAYKDASTWYWPSARNIEKVVEVNDEYFVFMFPKAVSEVFVSSYRPQILIDSKNYELIYE